MALNELTGTNLPAIPDDGMSAPVAATPIPPHVESVVASADDALTVATADVNATIADAVSRAESDITGAESDLTLSIATTVGAADAELGIAESTVATVVRKVTDDVFRELVYAEEDLRAAGIAVPYEVAQQMADLADPTGDAVAARISGEYPAAPSDGAIPATDPAADSVPLPPPPVTPPDAPPDPAPLPPPVPPPPAACPECAAGAAVRPEGIGTPVPPPVPGTAGYIPPPPCPSAYHVEYTTTFPYGVCVPDSLSPPPPASPEPPDVPMPPPPAPPVGPPPLPPLPVDFGRSRTFGFAEVWLRPDLCAVLNAEIADMKPEPPRPPGEFGGAKDDILDGIETYAHWTVKPFTIGLDAIKAIATGESVKEATGLKDAQVAISFLGQAIAEPVLDAMDFLGVQDKVAVSRLVTKLGVARRAEDLTKIPLSYLTQTEEYLLQYVAPMYLPSQSELDMMRVYGQMSEERWTCLTRSLGNIPEVRDPLVAIQATQPNISDVINLYRRDALDPVMPLRERLLRLGVMDSRHDKEYVALSEWIPEPPDLVRFMLRDVFDPAAVATGNLDKDFELKFYGPGGKDAPGPAAKWAAAHGVTAETMILFWRAHWEWPSPTQLYQMLHRLRPTRPEYVEWAAQHKKWLDEGKWFAEPVKPLVASEADVRNVLEIQDIAPAWIDRLMAVSYLPMTRTDAINAYMQGAMKEDELVERFQDNGYDFATAQRMLGIQRTLKSRRVSNVSGVWSVRKVIRAYQDGTISLVKARDLLTPLIPDAVDRQSALDGADAEVSALYMAAFLKRARRAYFVAEWDEARAVDVMKARGVDAGRARDLVNQWREDRDGRYKEPSAKLIVSWMKDGLMTIDDALTRLRRLGYTGTDAERIAYQGMMRWQEGIVAQVEKREAKIEKIIKDQKTAARELTQTLKDRQKELEKQKADMEKEQARIQKELDARKPKAPGDGSA